MPVGRKSNDESESPRTNPRVGASKDSKWGQCHCSQVTARTDEAQGTVDHSRPA